MYDKLPDNVHYVAIGSLVGLRGVKVDDVITLLRNVIRHIDTHIKIHVFGIASPFIIFSLYPRVYSFDSSLRSVEKYLIVYTTNGRVQLKNVISPKATFTVRMLAAISAFNVIQEHIQAFGTEVYGIK